MTELDNLCLLLDKLIALQKELFDLENQKTQVLLDGNTEELDDLVNQEQPYIMGSANIEKQRDLLHREMGLEGYTLKEVVEKYESQELKIRLNKLTDIITDLQKVNRRNEKILNSRLEVIDFVLSEIGFKPQEDVTYKNLQKK